MTNLIPSLCLRITNLVYYPNPHDFCDQILLGIMMHDNVKKTIYYCYELNGKFEGM